MERDRSTYDVLARVLIYALATTLTALAIFTIFSASYDVDPIWAWLQIPVVAAAWSSAWAWRHERWIAAGSGLLLAVLGLWGYLYFGPIVAIGLAAIAFNRARRQRTTTTRTVLGSRTS